MLLINVDKYSRQPIYEQVIEQIERLILQDLLTKDDLLPSVRSLSQELSVNPNTLQKAYAELDRRGYCYTAPGNGRFISENAKELLQKGKKREMNHLAEVVEQLVYAGVRLEEIVSEITKVYENTKQQIEMGEKNDNSESGH